MRSKTVAAALAAATVALLGAGCGSGASNGHPTSDGRSTSDGRPGGSGGTSSGAPSAAGNTGDGTLAIPADTDAEMKKSYQLQNAIAVCMRGKGFAYQAWIPKPTAADSPIDDEADYDASKAVLAKYGYGAYAQYVYPNDPNVPGHVDVPQDPNTAARGALDAAQQKLWDTTLVGDSSMIKQRGTKFDPNSCTGQAMAKVYPNQPDPAAASSAAHADAVRAGQDRQNLNGDPALVALAQSYANCLRGKGITVSSTQVTEIRTALRFQYFGEAARHAHDAPGGHLDVATATPLLTAEIQASLADLDCGRAFRAAYLPKLKQFPGAEGVG
ncbi:hypothetical protein [Catenulispora subtropica]|uniref:Lipoprotein n=1 Tax=Catenulispora subtropica TaxID=450798 RepID=A0ABN2SRF2_9ACTN